MRDILKLEMMHIYIEYFSKRAMEYHYNHDERRTYLIGKNKLNIVDFMYQFVYIIINYMYIFYI